MINRKKRKAFSMITAIFVIIMMATLTAFIQGITGKTIKATTQQYQKEQAVLLARSYTELALLYVSSYDRNATSSCLNTISANFGQNIFRPDGTSRRQYQIETEIRYIGKGTELLNNTISSCYDEATATPLSARTTVLSRLTGSDSFDNSMSLIIDVYIKYQDLDYDINQDNDPNNDLYITYHRRTLQKL